MRNYEQASQSGWLKKICKNPDKNYDLDKSCPLTTQTCLSIRWFSDFRRRPDLQSIIMCALIASAPFNFFVSFDRNSNIQTSMRPQHQHIKISADCGQKTAIKLLTNMNSGRNFTNGRPKSKRNRLHASRRTRS